MVAVLYLDSSAAVKFIVDEEESAALGAWLPDELRLTSSALLRTEVLRAVRRQEPGQLDRAREAIAKFALHDIDADILESAGALAPNSLRSLDAIHLATALRLADELEAIVTYDRRMIAGARALGLPVASPS
ncbi:type II toxin-antitoxin system VapC family toxin [soil metagenome]